MGTFLGCQDLVRVRQPPPGRPGDVTSEAACRLRRRGLGFELPYTQSERTRQEFIANFAAGYYFTPHNLTPFGDLVFYVAANLGQPIDSGPKDTNFSLTPGFRMHLGANWYWLTGVEVPVAHPKPFDVQVVTGLMKVF